MKESMAVLMQRTPKQLDNVLVDCYQKVMQLEGVQGVQVKKKYFLDNITVPVLSRQ